MLELLALKPVIFVQDHRLKLALQDGPVVFTFFLGTACNLERKQAQLTHDSVIIYVSMLCVFH